MLEAVRQFGLQYSDHVQGILGSLVAMPSLLSKVIEFEGQGTEILSIRDRVQLGSFIVTGPCGHILICCLFK